MDHPTSEDRAAYTAGLRALADAIDAHPTLPLPDGGNAYDSLAWYTTDEHDHTSLLAAFTGITTPTIAACAPAPGEDGDDLAIYYGRLSGLHMRLIVRRTVTT